MDKRPQHQSYEDALEEREIRVVTLSPGKWTEPIECIIRRFPLGRDEYLLSSPYSTLSYAWGSTTATELISLNGDPWPVTINLYNALHFIRDPEKPVRLWIDALSIDQHNAKERASQVQLMRDIYFKSSEVIIYLGDGKNHRSKKGRPQPPDHPPAVFFGDERDERHLDAFSKDLGEEKFTASSFHVFCFLRILGNTKNGDTSSAQFDNIGAHVLDALAESLRMMLLSPWWQRVWVVQELIVPRRAVVRYGAVEAPWDMLVAAASSSWNPSVIGPDNAKVLRYLSRHIQPFEHLRARWSPKSGVPLLTLLQDFCARRATDERDKVYGLLGLTSEGQRSLIRPNYTAWARDVYRDAAVALIGHTGSLSLWTGDLARKSTHGLQSWVPDWGAIYEEADRRRAQVEGVYNACGWQRPTLVTSWTEHLEFVRSGMRKTLAWLQEEGQESRRLPITMRRALQEYRKHFCTGKRLDTLSEVIRKLFRPLELSYRKEVTWTTALTLFNELAKISAPEVLEGTVSGLNDFLESQLRFGKLCPSCATIRMPCAAHAELAVKPLEDAELLRNVLRDAGRQCLRYNKAIVDDLASGVELLRTIEELSLQIESLSRGDEVPIPGGATIFADGTIERYPHEGPPLRKLFGRSVISYAAPLARKKEDTFDNGASLFALLSSGKKSTSLISGMAEMRLSYDAPETGASAKPFPLDKVESVFRTSTARGGLGAVLAVETSILQGVVQSVGERLITWSDKASAFETLRGWSRLAKQDFGYPRPVDTEGEDPAIVAARALVADAIFLPDSEAITTLPLGQRVRRLKPEDDPILAQWALRLQRLLGGGYDMEFPGEGEMKCLDEAIILATEGRVMFTAPDGFRGEKLGLGPASMRTGDQVHILPGGRTPIVLRPLDGDIQNVFTVVGDCYFDVWDRYYKEDETVPGECPGWLPTELLEWIPEKHAEAWGWSKGYSQQPTVNPLSALGEARERIFLV
ncbi:hypothetical protein OQA88_648 [Cercophora sp. LCS_1]